MKKLSDIIVGSSVSLRDALKQMTASHKGLLLVVNDSNHLLGILSDGDVRRALLDDTMLIVPVSQVMNTDPITATNAADAERLLRRYSLVLIPILDEQGCVKSGLYEEGGEIKELKMEDEAPGSPGAEAVVLIPARGGSKRFTRKNMARLGGKTLLAHAVNTAKAAGNFSIIVSTDDKEMADEAARYGAPVPWMRPDELSGDTTSSLEVIIHALEWAKEKFGASAPAYAVLLEPTAPLRQPEHIREALKLLEESGADCVVSVHEVPHIFNPEEVLRIEGGELKPYKEGRTMNDRKLRNEQKPVYVQNGLVYAFRIDSVLQNKNLYGNKTVPLITDAKYFADIDTEEDLKLAEFQFQSLKSAKA
jgi:CMP-N,N'-diacetyllegionaminic acid synthase